MLIDSHSHLNFKQFEKDKEEVIKRALDNDTALIIVGSQYTTSQRAIEIANNYPDKVYAAVGLHPIHLIDQVYTDEIDHEKIEFRTRAESFDIDKYRQLAQDKKVVAFGETGFDFYHLADHHKTEILAMQKETLLHHIALANELNKPVILHCRDAYAELLEFLNQQNIHVKGVIHCFSGSLAQAQEFLQMGFYIGFTGIITFKNAKNLQAIVQEIPLDKILVETDCPYLSPEPFRGKRNEPLYVQYVAKKIAEIKEISYDKVYKATTLNAKKLFNI